MWSALYAPDLMIQVTITGQLALLMLIETLEDAGIPVVSANTDGLTCRCPKDKYDLQKALVKDWERRTGFEMEETQYRSIHIRDVNSYLAIKTDGSVKGKGLLANPWEKDGPNIYKLHKNPTGTIVIDAVVALLRDGVPLRKTISECKDVRKFVSIRTVKGGATYEGKYIGKAVRWYHARGCKGKSLLYKSNGNKVPTTEGARPLMELPDVVPVDVNHDHYVKEAEIVLKNIGFAQRRLFDAA